MAKIEQIELFFDFEECDYAISNELVEGHQEADLQNSEYLARAIETGYRRILTQYQLPLSKSNFLYEKQNQDNQG